MAVDTDKNWRIYGIPAAFRSWVAALKSFQTAARRSPVMTQKWVRQTQEQIKWLRGKIPFSFRFRSLTSRLFVFNLVGVLVLIVGVFYFSQTRQWLIEDATSNLKTQGEIIAAAIARNATSTPRVNNFDQDQLLASDIAGADEISDQGLSALEFPIKPELITPIIRILVRPTNTRARVYSTDGTLLIDSDNLLTQGQILISDLPAISNGPTMGLWDELQRSWNNILASIKRVQLPLYKDIGDANGNAYSEVRLALNGDTTPLLLLNEKGQHIVSIGVPVRRENTVLGALQLTTRAGDIDKRLAAERWVFIVLAAAAILATVLSTLMLAGTIARPMKRLSEAANHVKRTIRARAEIPDMSDRPDEIGQLSGAFSDMTLALYRRIEASEKFAADVAHELKNPLTSVRSAAESLKFVKNDEDRQELVETIENDVQRLDRLITDIASASRLDAELAMGDLQPLDLNELLNNIIAVFNEIHETDGVEVKLHLMDVPLGSDHYVVQGHASRLSQVLDNLVSNAISFAPRGSIVWVRAQRNDNEIEIAIEDDGPGIPPENIDRIFKRFYTDRPEPDAFGRNSGLGLSISREIVLAHKGRIWAENRYGEDADITPDSADTPKSLGARFVIRLPAETLSKDNY